MVLWAETALTETVKRQPNNQSKQKQFWLYKKDMLIAHVSCVKDNEGLYHDDTATSLPGQPPHLVLNYLFESYCDWSVQSQAVNFNTGTDSPPQSNANAHLHCVTPVDMHQCFQLVLIFWWHWI